MKHLNRLGIILIFLTGTINLAIAEEENNWPKKIEKDGASVVIYQPQVESFSENNWSIQPNPLYQKNIKSLCP